MIFLEVEPGFPGFPFHHPFISAPPRQGLWNIHKTKQKNKGKYEVLEWEGDTGCSGERDTVVGLRRHSPHWDELGGRGSSSASAWTLNNTSLTSKLSPLEEARVAHNCWL